MYVWVMDNKGIEMWAPACQHRGKGQLMGKYFIFQIWGVRTETAALCQWGVLYGIIVVGACGLGFNMKQGLATFLVEWIQLKMARYFRTMMVNGVAVGSSFQGEPDHRIALLRLWGLSASGSWLHSRKQLGGCAGYHQRKGTLGACSLQAALSAARAAPRGMWQQGLVL